MGGPPENAPIAWHGYDMNPIAVGRSKLILAMLEEDGPLDQILQIWFSTCISFETAKTVGSSECLRGTRMLVHQSGVVKERLEQGPS